MAVSARANTPCIAGTTADLYGSLFQLVVGRYIAVWGLYWLAKQLSGAAPARARPPVRAALTGRA